MALRLEGKTIVVGVSGGIACYKAADLIRLLRTAGARVRVVMTRHATEFITPLTLQTLSGDPVSLDLFDLTQESQIGHIQLADSASAIVVAPATANLIARFAGGLADDLLTTVLLATQAPVLVAPSMNVHMWANQIVQSNVRKLGEHGVRIIEPGVGFLACGYEGAGRLADPGDIVAEVERVVGPNDLQGEKVLVAAGPNREPIDAVRFISNRSTGKMGYAVARAAWRRGADVVLVSGPTSLPDPRGVRTVPVTTAAQMHAAVRKEASTASMVFMAAAVADYRSATTMAGKMKKRPGPLTLRLERTEDILADLGRKKGSRLLVGFAAETDDVVANAERKLHDKSLDLMVANDVSAPGIGFESDDNAVTLIDAAGATAIPAASKDEIADRIIDAVVAQRTSRSRRPTRRTSPSKPTKR